MSCLSQPKVMALFCNGLGDALLTLPTVRALFAHFGDRFVLVADESFREFVARDLPALECHTIRFWKDGHDGKCFDPDQVLAIERQAEASIFVSLVPWISPSLARYLVLTGCLSIGHFTSFHVRVTYREDEHAALNAFKLARFLVPSSEYTTHARPLRLHSREWQFGCRVIETLPPGSIPVLVHLETAIQKRLPQKWVNQVVTRLSQRRANLVFINVGRNPTTLDLGDCNGTALELSDVSIFEGFAVAGSCKLFFGVDSCFLHAADMYGLPGVAVFRNSNPVEFGFIDTPTGVTYLSRRFSSSTASAVADLLAERLVIQQSQHDEGDNRYVEHSRG